MTSNGRLTKISTKPIYVFLTSVFTHMLPPEVRHYLREVRRVLRPQGRCLMTFLLPTSSLWTWCAQAALIAGSPTRATAISTTSAKRPEAAVAHREDDVMGFIKQAGFELHVPIRYGYWPGRQVQDPGPGHRGGQAV